MLPDGLARHRFGSGRPDHREQRMVQGHPDGKLVVQVIEGR
jgi:hypothetical protein